LKGEIRNPRNGRRQHFDSRDWAAVCN
jgi:hypothetical protein